MAVCEIYVNVVLMHWYFNKLLRLICLLLQCDICFPRNFCVDGNRENRKHQKPEEVDVVGTMFRFDCPRIAIIV